MLVGENSGLDVPWGYSPGDCKRTQNVISDARVILIPVIKKPAVGVETSAPPHALGAEPTRLVLKNHSVVVLVADKPPTDEAIA
jgi:hypothetical protein